MIESFVMNNVNNDKILNVEIPECFMYDINFCKYTSYMVTYTFTSSIELPTRIRLRVHESPARAKKGWNVKNATVAVWVNSQYMHVTYTQECANVSVSYSQSSEGVSLLPSPQLWAYYTAIQITCWSYMIVSQNVGEGRKTYSQFKPHRFSCCFWVSSSMFIFSFRPLLSFHGTNKTTNILRLLRDFKRKPQI